MPEFLFMDNVIKNSLNKLETSFEEFQTKFPLHSVSPPTAKVGTKEDIIAGDKFEVLEKNRKSDGTLEYKRLGIIRVTDINKIWDNNREGDWLGSSRSKLGFTEFEGDKGKYLPGMLLRKIYN